MSPHVMNVNWWSLPLTERCNLAATCWRIKAYDSLAKAESDCGDGQKVIACILPGTHWHCIAK